MKYLAFLFVLLFSFASYANTVKLGVPILAKLIICDKAEQAMAIVEAHENEGIESAQEVLRRLFSTPNQKNEAVCGIVQIEIIIKNVVYQTFIDSKEITVVEIETLDGERYFSPMIGIHVQTDTPA